MFSLLTNDEPSQRVSQTSLSLQAITSWSKDDSSAVDSGIGQSSEASGYTKRGLSSSECTSVVLVLDILDSLPPATKLGQTPPPRSRPLPPGPGPSQNAVHAGRYGKQAGGTHPTGMQSCLACGQKIKYLDNFCSCVLCAFNQR